MASTAPLSLLDRVRRHADTLPLDRAPLRRAGLLTGLLVVLLVLGKAFSPAPDRSTDRQDVRSHTEEVSEPASEALWTGGRVLAIVFLITGGGIALWLHRRSGGRATSTGSTLRVLETHTLGPGQSLRLVACGDEVLLLSVASDGATLLRHWPRATFEAEPVSFADALASLAEPGANSTQPDAPSLLTGEGLGEGSHTSYELASPTPDETQTDQTQTDDLDSLVNSVVRDNDLLTDELEAPARETVLARGTLFPPRAAAPHQFDVRHG